jgi:hypothetical protein
MLFSSEQFQSSFAATVVEDFHILKRLLETVYKALCASLQLGQGPLLRNANQRLEELARQKSALRLDIEPVDMVQYSNQSINQFVLFISWCAIVGARGVSSQYLFEYMIENGKMERIKNAENEKGARKTSDNVRYDTS